VASASTPAHTDVMFVFDTSGSMSGALEEAKSEIQEAMTQINTALPDVQYGLAEVRDYGGSAYDEGNSEDLPWKLDVPVTANQSLVSEAISGLSANGGGDAPEAYGRALWETDTNPTVGWRAGARHLIVLVADNVPHDNNLDEGIPEDVWVASSPWDTGEELPGPDGIAGTVYSAGAALDFQSILQQLANDGKPLEFVDYHGESGYLPYWENWAARTGGAAERANTGELVSKLTGAAEAGAEAPLPPCTAGQTRNAEGKCAATPAPPPSTPPPAAKPCAPVHGSIGKRLLASLKCTAAQTVLEAKCGFGVATLFALPAKSLRAVKTVKGLYDLSKIKKPLQPLAKLFNSIQSARFGKHAPRGFRTGGEIIDKLKRAKTAYDIMKLLPNIVKAVSKHDFSKIALDIADFAGLKACVEGMVNALE